jgi:hypothetical protein
LVYPSISGMVPVARVEARQRQSHWAGQCGNTGGTPLVLRIVRLRIGLSVREGEGMPLRGVSCARAVSQETCQA